MGMILILPSNHRGFVEDSEDKIMTKGYPRIPQARYILIKEVPKEDE